MKIFDSTMSMLQRAMDLQFKRHTVLASNVANSETPNFRARDVDFAGQLTKFMDNKRDSVLKTNSRHIDLGGTETDHLIFDNSGAMGADGNNVDLDIQTGKISMATRAYGGAAGLLSTKLRILRTATSGRGGA